MLQRKAFMKKSLQEEENMVFINVEIHNIL